MAAGVTPSICLADPIVSGLDLLSLSTTSFESPTISSKFKSIGIFFALCFFVFSISLCCFFM